MMARLYFSATLAAALCVGGVSAGAQEWLSPKPLSPGQNQQQKPAAPPAQPRQAQQQRPATQQPAVQPQHVGPDLAQAFGDWRISCVSRPGRACQITQRQVNTTNRTLTLMVELTLATQPKPRNILSVVTPLGVKLSPALSVRGEGGEIANVPLVTCVNTGCIHSGDIAAKQVEGMRRSKGLSTQLTDLKGQSSALTISTNGLEDAFQRVSTYLTKGG